MGILPDHPPAGWGEDTLSQFIDMSRNNIYASFANLREEYRRLSDIDAGFRLLVDHLKNPGDWFAALFLLRAHSSYLAGAQVALAGQLPETHMLLRGSIESCLYAFYFHQRPASRDTWLRRHDSDAARKLVRDEFKIAALFRLLKEQDKRLGAIGQELYDNSIDFGGHPNERSLSQVLKVSKDGAERHFHVNYLTGHTVGMELCLRRSAQSGVFALKVFQQIFPDRYDLIGLSERLGQLQQGL